MRIFENGDKLILNYPQWLEIPERIRNVLWSWFGEDEIEFKKLCNIIAPHFVGNRVKTEDYFLKFWNIKIEHSYILEYNNGKYKSRNLRDLAKIVRSLKTYWNIKKQGLYFWKDDTGIYHGSYEGKTYDGISVGWLFNEMNIDYTPNNSNKITIFMRLDKFIKLEENKMIEFL